MSNQTISLELEKRDVTGKKVKHLRKQGLVPAVVYKDGETGQSLQAEYRVLVKAVEQAGRNHPLSLHIGSHKQLAMIKTIDRDPVKNRIRHVAFHAINKNDKVTAEVPVLPRYAEGNEASPAERAGLVVMSTLDMVEVEALPDALPEAVYYDAEKLTEAGQHVTIADLQAPKGVEIKADPEQVIVGVHDSAAIAAANDAMGGDDTAASDVASDNGATEEVTTESK